MPCPSCVSAKVQCTFTPSKKRGIPTGYLQRLERTNEALVQLLGLFVESEPNGEQTLERLASKLAAESESERLEHIVSFEDLDVLSILDLHDGPVVSVKARPGRSQSHSSVRPGSYGPIAAAGNPGSSIAEPRVDSKVRFMGPSSGFDDSFIASFERLQMTQTTFDPAMWRRLIAPLSIINLLDVYFAFTHTLFPMVNREELIQFAYSNETDRKSQKSCLMWSMVMMGLNHTGNKRESDKFRARLMHDITISTLDVVHSLEAVQALLIQSWYFLGKGHWSNAWLIAGNAVRMATELGLHVDNRGPENDYSRRTWKCCCMIDTLISGRTGRVPQVSASDYTLGQEPEFGEEWELWRPPAETRSGGGNTWNGGALEAERTWVPEPARTFSVFNQEHRLNHINSAFIKVANDKSFRHMDDKQRRQVLQSYVQQLKTWLAQLPPQLDPLHFADENPPAEQLMPHVANLYMNFTGSCSMVHVLDCDSRYVIDQILPPETLVRLTINILSAYVSRFTWNTALVQFEYYISLCLTVVFKTFIQNNDVVERLSEHPEFNTLLKFLDGTAATWAGASVSYQYFWVMKQAELDKVEERKKQRSYQPLIQASIHSEPEPLGDLDFGSSLDVAVSSRSNIGRMIEKLESEGHIDFSNFEF